MLSSMPGRDAGDEKTTTKNTGKGIAFLIVFAGLILLFVK